MGCATGDILECLDEVEYIGVDMNPGYIDSAESRYGDQARFYCRKIGHDSFDDISECDIVLANGLVHHLDGI